jgi:hypothetical protein
MNNFKFCRQIYQLDKEELTVIMQSNFLKMIIKNSGLFIEDGEEVIFYLSYFIIIIISWNFWKFKINRI